MYQMNSNLQALGSSKNWHWPGPLAKDYCLNSKSNWGKIKPTVHSLSFRAFVVIMYINGHRPHKQVKCTQTRYITQYGPSGQSENYINKNN